MDQTLTGTKVVEIGEGVALAYAARLLADLGADVVKVEPPGGDGLRHFPPYLGGRPGSERATQHHHLNANKRSVVVDVTCADERSFLGDLMAGANLVIESTVPGTLGRWSLGWDDLHLRNQATALVSVTPFGQTGPYSTYRSSALVTFAMGGAMTSTGLPEREPVRLPGDCHLYYAGSVAALAALAALGDASQRGVGSHVDVSAMDTLLSSADWRAALLLGFQYRGIVGRRQPIAAGALPSGIFPCGDGYVSMITMSAHAGRMADAMDSQRLRDLFGDPRNAASAAARDVVQEELYGWLLTRTRAEITATAQAARWPVVAVNTPAEVVAAEHLAGRHVWARLAHPEAGEVVLLAPPVRMTDGGGRHRSAAPLLGADRQAVTDEIAARPPTVSSVPRQPSTDRLLLDGVRVADMTIVWAGPFATQLLADLGAEVLRVENPFVFPPATKGMMPRPPEALIDSLGALGGGYAAAPEALPDRPYNRLAANNAVTRNKQSFTCDTRRPEGLEVLMSVLERSDVLIENFAAGTLEKVIGLTVDELLERFPQLVVLRLPPFGSTGPWSGYLGFGAQFEAMAGFTSLWGYADSDPTTNFGTAYLDGATGPAAAFAVLAALERRRQTGRGQLVEMAQSENLMQHIGESLVGEASGGGYERTWGNRDHRYAPQGVYPCAGDDRWVAITVADDEQWRALAAAIGTDVAGDADLATVDGRSARHDELDGIIAAWTSSQDQYDVFHRLQAAGVAAGPVLDERAVFADPHLGERRFFRPLPSRDCGVHLHPGHLFSGIPMRWELGAPALGEHNDYVYRELLGFDDARYDDFVAAKHIADDYLDATGQPL